MKLADIHMRDPFILPVHEDGYYYLFGTTDPDPWNGPGIGFDAWKSKDLEDWEGPFTVFRPLKSFWADKHFWAPEVHRWKGRYFLFASFKADGKCRATQIFSADCPLGPYIPVSSGPVTPDGWECLDGTLCVERDGKPWLVFCHEWLQIGDGQICAMPLSDNLDRSAGKARVLFQSSDAPWTVPVLHDGLPARITDGPWLHRDILGTLRMMWSSQGKSGYALGQAISPSGSISGPWIHDELPVFSKDGGHGMVFQTFDNRGLLILHQPNISPLERPRIFPAPEGWF